MFNVLRSDWERIWARRKTLLSMVFFVVLLGFLTLWLKRGGIGFYTPELETRLNSLNFSAFLLKECSFFLTLIIFPMLFVDSFGGEYHSGALRMVLIRPYSPVRLLLAKWLSMALLIFIFLAIPLIFGQIAGWLFFPHVSETSFYPDAKPVGIVGAMAFSVLFYFTVYLIYLALSGLGSLICTIVSNPILAFFLILGSLFGTLYISRKFQFLLLNGEITFQVLNGIHTGAFLVTLFAVIVVTYGATFLLWKRKNWVL
jgi:ABC-2 type transport system permease protein